jgi:3-phosphoshikimate 1-carboxyvinyltransferase
MVLGTILPDSRILIKDINLNPSRIGIIKALKRMGSDIQVLGNGAAGFEPIGDIIIKSSKLKSTIIKKEEIPSLIDELPILMVAACFAKGKSVFEGVGELRIKETDRIRSMSENLKKMGADIRVLKTPKSEKLIIQGRSGLIGAAVKSFGDHRTAMSMVVAGLAAFGETRIDNISCINKSFPNFLSLLKTIIQ